LQDLVDQVAHKEKEDLLVLPDLLEKADPEVNRVNVVQPVQAMSVVNKDPLVHLEKLDNKGLLVHVDSLDHLEHKENKVYQGNKDPGIVINDVGTFMMIAGVFILCGMI
jgi:hypothetical protein